MPQNLTANKVRMYEETHQPLSYYSHGGVKTEFTQHIITLVVGSFLASLFKCCATSLSISCQFKKHDQNLAYSLQTFKNYKLVQIILSYIF